MSKAIYQKKPKHKRPRERKIRQCLKCREPFDSAWLGERVCPKCKASSTWRGGASGLLEPWDY